MDIVSALLWHELHALTYTQRFITLSFDHGYSTVLHLKRLLASPILVSPTLPDVFVFSPPEQSTLFSSNAL